MKFFSNLSDVIYEEPLTYWQHSKVKTHVYTRQLPFSKNLPLTYFWERYFSKEKVQPQVILFQKALTPRLISHEECKK